MDEAQLAVVTQLDQEIDRLRHGGTPEEWGSLYESLTSDKRAEIDALLASVIADLKIGGAPGRLGP